MTITAQWQINQYTIAFDTDGGTEIAPITQDYGTAIAAPANPTREGYTFIGWDKEIPTTVPAKNVTIKAQWKINQYTITFDTDGGSEIADKRNVKWTDKVFEGVASPTKNGYNFIGWTYNDMIFTADTFYSDLAKDDNVESITLKAEWREKDGFTVRFDTAGGSSIANKTNVKWTDKVLEGVESPVRNTYEFIGWTYNGKPFTADAAYADLAVADSVTSITLTAKWRDIEDPTGEIIIGTNKWKTLLNNITFGLFFKETQTVTINATDNSGEKVRVEYLLADREMTILELADAIFTEYTGPFSIDPDHEYIIYVMLVDTAGNGRYISSDGMVLDGTAPVINGIENGKTYCEAQTVTIDERYLDTVTVNGTAVTLDEQGSFVLSPADGEQKIVVTDKAGNTAELTVTVNDGHTFGEWKSNGDGTHTRKCTVDGCTGAETDNCADGDKNHKCDNCDAALSECADTDKNHICDYCEKTISNHEDTDKNHICDYCEKTISNHDDADKNHICDYCGKTISNHEDTDKNHICDYCGKTITNHDDTDKNHICDYCEKTISNHEDTDKNHVCDYCEKTISNHDDADKNHICDYCEKTISNHEDTDKNHVCDYCGKVITNHEDTDKNHICDYCGKIITNHNGGKATCTEKAVCEICGKTYGEINAANHTDLEHNDARTATEDNEGNIEYWHCDGCGKNFSDKDGANEITTADIVIEKLPKEKETPYTGENSNIMLWIILLFISGGVCTVLTVKRKKSY